MNYEIYPRFVNHQPSSQDVRDWFLLDDWGLPVSTEVLRIHLVWMDSFIRSGARYIHGIKPVVLLELIAAEFNQRSDVTVDS